jgi:hypothetical protein
MTRKLAAVIAAKTSSKRLQLALGAADRNYQMPALVCVTPGEGNGSFAVDQSCEVSSFFRQQRPRCPVSHRLGPRRKPPASKAGGWMVEAAGQPVCFFRSRLDYAFTPATGPGAGRVIPVARDRNPSAGSAF